jgi:hypothetical protein
MGRHGHYQGACGSSQAVSLPVMRSNGAALPLLVAQRRLCFWSSRHCARCVSTCMVVPICLPECPCCSVAMPLMCLRACVPMMPQVLPLWSSPSPPPSPSSPCMRALLSPAPLSTSALIPGALRVAVPAFASPERPRVPVYLSCGPPAQSRCGTPQCLLPAHCDACQTVVLAHRSVPTLYKIWHPKVSGVPYTKPICAYYSNGCRPSNTKTVRTYKVETYS